MLKKDLMLKSPLELLDYENNDIIAEGEFGAVLARAGVGKTALLVQLAINAILRNKNVLHISLNDPVKKVDLWYQQVLNNLSSQSNIQQIKQLWESLLPSRFIMTFRMEEFSAPQLEERLTALTEQNIFSPNMVIVDGFPFNVSGRDTLSEFKALAQKHSMQVWFTVRTHRHEKPAPDGLPVQLDPVIDLFDVAIQLQPEGEAIQLKVLKGKYKTSGRLPLLLDPSTLLVKDGE